MNCTSLTPPPISRLTDRRRASLLWLRPAVCLAGVLWCAAASWATDIDELSADQTSVRELMRLETAQALQRLRASRHDHGRVQSLGMSGHGAMAPGTSVARLIAIYGVGQKLMAEVRVDDRTLLFMRGKPEAIGPGRTHAMRLLSINERCVKVAMGERQESLCAPVPNTGKG